LTRRVIRAVGHAARGLRFMLRTQPNARIHAVASAAIFLAALLLKVSAAEWVALILACALVWIAEAFNTALETLADAVHPEFNEGVGRAKDAAAGGVLAAAVAAAGVGLWIFVPRVMHALASC
jgi:diacylglycerol kinase (ATP)